MILFTNYYKDKNPARQKEIDECLIRNVENPEITEIICMMDSIIPLPTESAKAVPYLVNGRPTYSDIFDEINTLIPAGKVVIIANSDIFFDDTIKLAEGIKTRECYALSRIDYLGDKVKPFFRADSQDVWILRTPVVEFKAYFTMGECGCDNHLAHLFKENGYKITNPCHSINCFHLHNTGIRNYTAKDRIPPPYHLLPPTKL